VRDTYYFEEGILSKISDITTVPTSIGICTFRGDESYSGSIGFTVSPVYGVETTAPSETGIFMSPGKSVLFYQRLD